MPAKRKATAAPAPAKTLEVQLWDAANKMRGAVPPTDYMHVCLGLVFLRYLSAAFERKEAELKTTPYVLMEDPEEYQADNVFWVPLEARWGTIQGFARSADVGKRLDDAMRAIERDNDELKGVLPKIFGKADFSAQMLGGLIDHFTNLNLTGMADDFDFLGRVYEFFLGEFSAMQGKAGGEQFTPRSMVTLMVDMIEPYRGRIYDCCRGTGGFYVQSNRFVLAHSGRLEDISVYGQERNPETYRLARMNLAIRGITGDLRWNNEGTLLKDAFPDMRFDFNLANPPFNIKVIEMLQQNWALIEPSTEGVKVYFVSDTSGVFDEMAFDSTERAEAALILNGFRRFASEERAASFLRCPQPPFTASSHPNGPIYSSGQFWKSP